MCRQFGMIWAIWKCRAFCDHDFEATAEAPIHTEFGIFLTVLRHSYQSSRSSLWPARQITFVRTPSRSGLRSSQSQYTYYLNEEDLGGLFLRVVPLFALRLLLQLPPRRTTVVAVLKVTKLAGLVSIVKTIIDAHNCEIKLE